MQQFHKPSSNIVNNIVRQKQHVPRYNRREPQEKDTVRQSFSVKKITAYY